MELLENKDNSEGVEFLTLDFQDAFEQLHVVASERPFLAGGRHGRFLLTQNSVVWSGIRTTCVVSGGRCNHTKSKYVNVENVHVPQEQISKEIESHLRTF